MFCVNCGKNIDSVSKFCSGCGSSVNNENNPQQQQPVVQSIQNTSSEYIYPSDPPKSPIIAAFLSFIFIGVGQFYLGQWQKFVAALVLCILLLFTGIFSMLLSIIWIGMIFDAYFIGAKLAKGVPVKKWQFFN